VKLSLADKENDYYSRFLAKQSAQKKNEFANSEYIKRRDSIINISTIAGWYVSYIEPQHGDCLQPYTPNNLTALQYQELEKKLYDSYTLNNVTDFGSLQIIARNEFKCSLRKETIRGIINKFNEIERRRNNILHLDNWDRMRWR
jgi:hypothetical protein